MATTTTHYGFTKPGVNDYVDISVLNANYDNLDNVIYNNLISALADLAPEYDATATYSVGDYVTYNKTLYKCTTAIATAEAFDDTKWTAVKVGGELKSHDTRISDLEAGVELEGEATNSFDDGIDSYFKKVVSTIVPVQAGSGTPSPTNVRAISGFTECTVTDTNGTDTNTATISFGSAGTVYSGTVDLTTGVLTVDKAMVDLGTLTWVRYAETSIFSTNSLATANIKIPEAYTLGNYLCSSLDQVLSNASVDNYTNVYMMSTSKRMWSRLDDSYTDATAFTNALSGVQFVYELATPQEYQLTPAQLRSLVGANRLTSSTGKVTEVEYIKNKTIAWLLDLIRA